MYDTIKLCLVLLATIASATLLGSWYKIHHSERSTKVFCTGRVSIAATCFERWWVISDEANKERSCSTLMMEPLEKSFLFLCI